MKERQEGPLERRFWKAVMVLVLFPLVVSFGVIIIGVVIGEGREAISAVMPLFLFGMAMVGFAIAGPTLRMMVTGEHRDWFGLLMSCVWLFFFGRAFLRTVGILNSTY